MNLEQLRAFCLTLPGTTEDVKWEDHLCFSVGGKMYYVTSFTHPSSSLKVRDEEFELISSTDGIIPAPYMARNKWVQIAHYDRFSMKEWEHYIKQSYELVKSKLPKKLQQEIESGKGTAATKKEPVKKAAKAKPKIKTAAAKKTGIKKAAGKKAAAKPVKKKAASKAQVKKKTAAKKAAAKRPDKRSKPVKNKR